MRKSGSRPLGAGVIAVAALLPLGVLIAACTERNPHYDPDGGSICIAGERQCDSANQTIEICTEDATGFTPLRDCFEQSQCADGLCVPGSGASACDRAADCTANQECTVLVDPLQPDRLGTWCLQAPVAAGRPGGQACDAHAQCRSGWCFRQVCYEACLEATDCTNVQHQCIRLNITVDGVRDSFNIQGCVP